ncbi:MBL fold metallo-hydrolase [Candidatus Riflebacteria bacterium]
MLQICFPGTASAKSTRERIGSSLFIPDRKESILIDCPGGIGSRLACLGPANKRIKHLFVTHRHIDHSSGFIEFIYFLYLDAGKRRKQKLDVYAHTSVVHILQKLFSAYNLEKKATLFPVIFHALEFASLKPVEISSLKLTPFESPHDPSAPTFGLIIEKEKNKVVYTSDCNFKGKLPTRKFKNSALMITEATTLRPQSPFHATPLTAIEFCKKIGLKNLAFIHLDPEFWENHKARETLKKKFSELNILFPEEMELFKFSNNRRIISGPHKG